MLRVLFLTAMLGWSVLVGGQSVARAGLTVNGYSADRHDRFNNSPLFVGNPFVWSGVGRTTAGRWGTLVSPSFVISATHFAPENGGAIRFYSGNNPSGSFVERSIVSSTRLTQAGFPGGSDLTLTLLNAPVTDAGILSYPIAAPTSPASLIGRELFVWGQADTPNVHTSMRLGRNEISNVFAAVNDGTSVNSVIVYDFNTTTGLGADEARLVSGDSGGPTFVIGPDGPTILGIHWFNTTPADGLTGNRDGSGDTLVSSFINELNTAMAAAGSSERVRVSVVPEPATGMLLWWGVAVTLVARRRRC